MGFVKRCRLFFGRDKTKSLTDCQAIWYSAYRQPLYDRPRQGWIHAATMALEAAPFRPVCAAHTHAAARPPAAWPETTQYDVWTADQDTLATWEPALPHQRVAPVVSSLALVPSLSRWARSRRTRRILVPFWPGLAYFWLRGEEGFELVKERFSNWAWFAGGWMARHLLHRGKPRDRLADKCAARGRTAEALVVDTNANRVR